MRLVSRRTFTVSATALATAGLIGVPASASGRGHALVVGIDALDPRAYFDFKGDGSGGRDAALVSDFLRSRGFTVTGLYPPATRQPRVADVMNALGEAAANTKAGDLFVLYYAGHGGVYPDKRHDPNDMLGEGQFGLVNTYALYDRMAIGHEFYDAWTKFAPGVRIVAIADCCNSGNPLALQARLQSLNSIESGSGAGSSQTPTPPSPGSAVDAPVSGPGGRTLWLRRLRDDILTRIIDDPAHRAMYDRVWSTIRYPQGTIASSIIRIGATINGGRAYDDGEHGLFTRYLVALIDAGIYAPKTYPGFVSTLQRLVSAASPLDPNDSETLQIPQYARPIPAANRAFENSPPFAI